MELYCEYDPNSHSIDKKFKVLIIGGCGYNTRHFEDVEKISIFNKIFFIEKEFNEEYIKEKEIDCEALILIYYGRDFEKSF